MNQKTALLGPLACCALATCTDEPAVILTPVEEWITQPHYEIGDQMEGDALFARISSVVPTADGSRVYVLDRQAFEVTINATHVWGGPNRRDGCAVRCGVAAGAASGAVALT